MQIEFNPSRRRFLRDGTLLSAGVLGSLILLPDLAQAEALVPAVPVKQTAGLKAFDGLGLNIDPRVIDCNPELLKRIGTTWVRMVLLRDSNYQQLIKSLRDSGIETVGVINRQSIKFDPDITDVYDEEAQFSELHFSRAAEYYGREYPDLRFMQLGNEPDDEGGSSWGMKPEIFTRLLTSFRDKLPERFLIGAGLSSGQPGYLENLPPLEGIIDAIALHPYGVSLPNLKSASDHTQADDLIRRYSEICGLPIIITELGVNHAQYTSEGAARFIESSLKYFRRTVRGVAYYGASDLMLDEHGLFDKNGNPKLSLRAYMRAALGNNPPPLENFRLAAAA